MTDTTATLSLPRPVPVQLIAPNGETTTDEHYPMPSDDTLVAAYGALVRGRRLNEQCSARVRQGRLAVYPSSLGLEACQVAAALALAEGDWVFPTYRDIVTMVARGVEPMEALLMLRGDWHSGYDPNEHCVAPQATPLATQLLHATGLAHAAVLKGEPTVALAMCGDGSTSEGDFHEALNFAAVFKLPVVFFVQNNEFAISVPLSRQTAAPSLAHKAIGYGMPGERVDGNDAAALLSVLGEAVERARRGDGPTLIEAHTYRMLAHTNADDDTRYREKAAVAEWAEKDPVARLRTHLESRGLLTEELASSFAEAAEAEAATLRTAMHQEDPLDPEDLFAYVTSNPSQARNRQRAMLRDELERAGGAA